MKKVLSVVLALVMMLSVFSVTFVSAGTDADCTMVAGETRTVSLPGAVYDDYVIVRYVAAGNGKIVISSDGKNPMTCNPVLEVYKDSLKTTRIDKVENNGSYHNFKYELNCEAGTTYYFAMHNSLSATSWDVTIECLHEVYDDGICLTCLKPCDHVKDDNIVGCCPCGEKFDGEDIEVGKEYEIKADTDYRWFRFDVKKTAPYILQSENPDDEDTVLINAADPEFIITDETGKIVFANDKNVSGENNNFCFPFLFEGSERYFIGVKSSKSIADEWFFTFVDGTKHTIEESKEVPKKVLDEEGNAVLDENGDFVYEVEVDAEGNPVVDAEGNPVYVTETVTETIEHSLKYSQKNATCQEAGYTLTIFCETCKDAEGKNLVIVDGDEIPKLSECVDADNNNYCDFCNRVINEAQPEEPDEPDVECSCDCHGKGIKKFFFDFLLLFQRIFRTNRECACGVVHY